MSSILEVKVLELLLINLAQLGCFTLLVLATTSESSLRIIFNSGANSTTTEESWFKSSTMTIAGRPILKTFTKSRSMSQLWESWCLCRVFSLAKPQVRYRWSLQTSQNLWFSSRCSLSWTWRVCCHFCRLTARVSSACWRMRTSNLLTQHTLFSTRILTKDQLLTLL